MGIDMKAQAELRLAGEIERLAREFEGTFDRATIEEYVRGSYESLRGTHVSDYVVSIAGRFARERLRAVGQSEGRIKKHVPEILFVCAKNSGRSQMAAAFANVLSGGRVSARSAGEHHAHDVQSTVVEAMRETGIDLLDAFPKPVMDEVVRAADVVVTMGCGENTCPYYPGKSYRDWEVVDPSGKSPDDVRKIRDGLRAHVTQLLAEMHVLAPQSH